MKKIALYFGLIIASLSALDSEIPQNQEPSGWFFWDWLRFRSPNLENKISGSKDGE